MSTPSSLRSSLELLLDTLLVPDELQSWAGLLREQLRGEPLPAQLAVTLRDVAELALESRTREQMFRAEVLDLLARVHHVIEELEQQLQTTDQQMSAGYQATRKIDLMLERQLDEMEAKLRFSSSVEQVRDAVNQRLAVLRAGLDDGRGKRSLQFASLQAQLMKLSGSIRNLHSDLDSRRETIHRRDRRALTDSASQLPNPVAFEQRMQQEYARWVRYRAPAALLLIGVAGDGDMATVEIDAVVRRLAELLQPVIRGVDFLARFSATTLGVLMPETSLVATETLIERLRESLASLDDCSVQLRFGGAALESGDTAQGLIRRAMAALAADQPDGERSVASA